MVSGLVSQEPVLCSEVAMVVVVLGGMGSSSSSSRRDASGTSGGRWPRSWLSHHDEGLTGPVTLPPPTATPTHPAMGHDFIHFTKEGTEAQAGERPPKGGKDSGSLDQADMGPGVKPEPGSALNCVTCVRPLTCPCLSSLLGKVGLMAMALPLPLVFCGVGAVGPFSTWGKLRLSVREHCVSSDKQVPLWPSVLPCEMGIRSPPHSW